MNPRRSVLAILLATPLALTWGCDHAQSPQTRSATPAPEFVAASSCAECHPAQLQAWTGSHHDRAMQVAEPNTVLGDFSGTQASFSVVDGSYRVRSVGADGKPGEFPAPYTFGVAPLQQMLVALPGGRLQAFTTAWDSERRSWFPLYPDEKIAPEDPLHWTGRYQRWNTMCADCHSTGVQKGYDEATDSYRTTWAEIDVGCQACHGPGSAHVAWAREGAKREGATPDGNGLAVQLAASDARREVESCAPCHARRAQLLGSIPYGREFLDGFLPSTLDPGLYHVDGQIDGEVYEYGSFLQSKMYARGVRCTDCHDAHRGKLVAEGNALCGRCHSTQPDPRFPTLSSKTYDSPEHHHHEAGSSGASCVGCHMPTRYYMVVDPRQDHSIRVPRPDLSVKLGTPNACNSCHADRDPEWADAAVARWYGSGRRQEAHFGEVFAAARKGDAGAIPELARIAGDAESPAIVRATALSLLEPAGEAALPALALAGRDADPWLRSAAASACDALPAGSRLRVAEPLLSDPVLAVRIEAARVLSAVPPEQVPEGARERLASALREFEAAQRVQADLPGAHLNLAVVYANRGDTARAEAEYRLALRMDPRFLPASFNLATLLNQLGRNEEAERVLRDAIRRAPGEGELYYSLALLLAESGRTEAAAAELDQAAALMPDRPRVRYNQGLALMRIGKRERAEAALRSARELAPRDPEILNALAILYAESGDWQRALPLARQLVELVPGAPGPRELLARIESELAAP